MLLQRLVLSLADVEANFLVVYAYSDTNPLYVSILMFTVTPWVMFFSYLFLKPSYVWMNYVGVLLGLVGCFLTLAIKKNEGADDIDGMNNLSMGNTGDPTTSSGKSLFGFNLGIFAVLIGSVLYAVSNVTQELILKKASTDPLSITKTLTFIGLFGGFICGFQAYFTEYDAIVNNLIPAWENNMAKLFFILYQVFLVSMYASISLLLTYCNAIVFNLSMASTDFYVMIYEYALKGELQTTLILSFLFTISGVIVYGLADGESTTTKQDQNDDGLSIINEMEPEMEA